MKLLSEAVALYLLIVSSLARAISPDPDEAQRALPWPSWIWQRLSLLAVFPIAGVVFWVCLTEAAWAGLGAAVVMALVAGYGGLATSWMRATRQARYAARLAAAASVAAGWTTLLLLFATALLYAVGLVLVAVAGFLLARDVIRDLLRKVG